jgi:hypothetical protein
MLIGECARCQKRSANTGSNVEVLIHFLCNRMFEILRLNPVDKSICP